MMFVVVYTEDRGDMMLLVVNIEEMVYMMMLFVKFTSNV